MEDREITVNNIIEMPYSYINKTFYKMIHLHVDMISMDNDKFVYLLGYYAALYQYFSELYTFCIGKMRQFLEADQKSKVSNARDKRDMMECLMKSVKLQYDSLSRKITVLTPQVRDS